jgi:hypothetical protein
LSEELQREVNFLLRKNQKLRGIIRAMLKESFDDGFCRWCWRLSGHHPGCWVLVAQEAVKD